MREPAERLGEERVVLVVAGVHGAGAPSVLPGGVFFARHLGELGAPLTLGHGPEWEQARAAVLLGAIIWLLVDIGLLRAESVSAVTWIVLVAIAMILAIGVSWSHFWRRITGQINVEDVDD